MLFNGKTSSQQVNKLSVCHRDCFSLNFTWIANRQKVCYNYMEHKTLAQAQIDISLEILITKNSFESNDSKLFFLVIKLKSL